jgi:hypothetical protein
MSPRLHSQEVPQFQSKFKLEIFQNYSTAFIYNKVRMHFNLAVFVLFLFGTFEVSSSKSSNDQDPPKPNDPYKNLEDHCSADLLAYCPKTSSPMWSIYCLYEHKSQLSPTCQEYLGSTTLGGCNQEALNLCGDKDTVEDIVQCLRDHTSELSADCLKNIKNNDEQTSRIKEMRNNLTQATRGVTILSAVYLLIPVFFSFWCISKFIALQAEQEKILRAGKATWKLDSEVMKIIRACDNRLPSSSNPSDSSVPETWQISFCKLNYWSGGIKQWTGPLKQTRKKILNNVSCFECYFPV